MHIGASVVAVGLNRTLVHRGCRDHLSALAQVNLASEPSQVSLLWVLWCIKCCGGNRRMCSILNGAQPVHFEEKNWLEEQYSGGCYVSTFPTGVMSKYGKTLREPFGRVYFAGTETATSWPGYMNGAVQAGERAAREVLCAMKMIRKDQIWVEEPEFKGAKARPFELSFLERHPPHVLLVAATGALAASGVACVAAYGVWKAVTAVRGP
ncbi:hypothetical protein HPB49_020359 [Dermacentor silvarum]|uniref:Uncharacterized protein n=1 Tax=Dermacentor silvarum TaxID=543639 RepID=A0ACB8DFP7_DERSI|nr:hypothetical protein HPB49_020359 [Dermacentor silvarum]